MGFKTYTCPIAKNCGGCEWLAVPYPIQLKRKSEYIDELFGNIFKQDKTEVLEIASMEEPVHYRNKAATPFAPGKKGSIQSGFYAAGSHRIISCPECMVEDETLRPILNKLAKTAERLHIPAYNENIQKGTLRHAIVRSALYTDDIMLTIVTNGKKIYKADRLIEELMNMDGAPTTIVQNINTLNTNAMLGRKNSTLAGSGFMFDKILGATFKIGPTSFYQTNPKQTEVLYQSALDMAELESGMSVMDAYCGCGTIGICAAHEVSDLHVTGVEKNGEAIGLARQNAKLNHLDGQARFVRADATEYMLGQKSHFDVVIMDPPRAGSTPEFLNAVDKIKPKKLVYISCNPKTQVRDIEHLRKRGWKLKKLQAVDMFPHTKHVETVALLTKSRSAH